MLTAIRDRATGWLAWAIVILISVPFALWGINEYFQGGAEVTVARVNGGEISQAEFQQAVERERRALRQMLGAGIDTEYLSSELFRRAVLDRMIDQRLLLQWARDQGYRIGDAQLGSLIRAREPFQREGEFSPELYQQALSASGFSVSDFEQQLRRQEAMDQLREGIEASGFVAGERVDRVLRLAAQQRTFDYVVLQPSAFEAGIEISDEAIRQEYETNTEQYRVPESVKVNYLELSVGALAEQVDVDEAELREVYERNIDQYGTAETRRASHILIEVPADADEATQEQALEQARELATQARAGEDFAALAREHSDDAGSASQGGDLGIISRGAMPDAFEEALFGLEEGGVSDPVRTRFGYHVVKLTEHQEGEQVPFEAVRDELAQQLRRQRAEEQFLDMAETFRNLVFEHPDSLEVASEELALPIQTSEWFDRDGGEGVAANANVVEVAFSPEVLEERLNSPVVELGPDRLVALHVVDHRPSAIRELDDVRDEIREQLVRDRAAARATEAGADAVQRLRGGEDWEAIVSSLDAESREVAAVRAVAPQETPAGIVDAVFASRLPKEGEAVYGGVDLVGGYAVFRLTGVEAGDPGSLEQGVRERIAGLVRQRARADAVAAYVDGLRARAKIEVYPEAM